MTWFIDGGAHRGESIRLARTIYGEAIIAVAVEPAAECWPDLVVESAILIPAALSATVGRVPFYRATYEVSATTVSEKTTGGVLLDAPELVPSVTLTSLIRAVPRDEALIVKLDIEGAEFDVLEQALDDGALRLASDLYADFHGDRIAGFPRERQNRLVGRLLAAGFTLPKWCPVENRVFPWGERWMLP